MPDMWERARVRHESTPVPEELEFAVASALRAGQRRLRGRRALRRSVSGVLAGCACFVLLVNANPTFARAVSDVPVLGGLARVFTVSEYTIDEREQLGERSIVHLAVRDEHVYKPARMNSLRTIAHELKAHQRLVICVGNANVALGSESRCGIGDGLGLHEPPGHFSGAAGLRDGGVLAERAAHVATVRADRKDARSRHEARERLLLDRIECERGDAPVVLVDHYAIVCHARTTDAMLPFGKRTGMRTDGTRDALTASRHVPHRR